MGLGKSCQPVERAESRLVADRAAIRALDLAGRQNRPAAWADGGRGLAGLLAARQLAVVKSLEAIGQPMGQRRTADRVAPMTEQAVGAEQFEPPGCFDPSPAGPTWHPTARSETSPRRRAAVPRRRSPPAARHRAAARASGPTNLARSVGECPGRVPNQAKGDSPAKCASAACRNSSGRCSQEPSVAFKSFPEGVVSDWQRLQERSDQCHSNTIKAAGGTPALAPSVLRAASERRDNSALNGHHE